MEEVQSNRVRGTLRGERITEEFQTIVDEYVRTHYGAAQTETAA